MKTIKITLILAMIFVIGSASAQQNAMFTQYMFNGLVINPAYAGSQEQASASLSLREQWVGLEGAPSTKTFSAHSPLLHRNVGVGIIFINDRIGVAEQNGLYASYAYRIMLTKESKLSMGIQAGVTNHSVDFSRANDQDPVFSSGSFNEYHPNIGFGLYYHSKKFFAGISVPQAIEKTLDVGNIDSESKLIRHYFVSSGYILKLNHSIKLNPTVLLKYVQDTPLGMDINANVIIHDLIWAGVSVRNFNSLDLILQLQVTEKLRAGYSYDFAETSSLGAVNSGSHEIMLTYAFQTRHKLVTTPRFF